MIKIFLNILLITIINAQEFRSPEEQQTINIYKSYNQAVVFISTVSLSVDPFDLFAQMQPQRGNGSGVIIDKNKGIILTNLHVIQDADKIEIILSDSKPYPAKLLGIDKELDLAVLQLLKKPENLIDIPSGDSDKLEVGQKVLAIGNPFGLNSTLTTGIISSLNRMVRNDAHVMKGMIQTDAAINPGNSGGPLIDGNGKLIGINTSILSQSGDSAGIGFATPINKILSILPDLIKYGKVKYPTIGWILVDTDSGVIIRRVMQNSPAAKAGVVPLERITERGYLRDFTNAEFIININGKQVSSVDEINEIVRHNGTERILNFELLSTAGRKRNVQMKPVLE